MVVKKSQRGANNGESQSEMRLTPPEEKAGTPIRQGQPDDGTLRVNTGDLKLPQEVVEEEEAKAAGLRNVDPAVMFILCFSLIFIAAIAFVIWTGWEPPR